MNFPLLRSTGMERRKIVLLEDRGKRREKRELTVSRRVSEKIGREEIKIPFKRFEAKDLFHPSAAGKGRGQSIYDTAWLANFLCSVFRIGWDRVRNKFTRPYPRDILFTTVSTGLCEGTSSIDPAYTRTSALGKSLRRSLVPPLCYRCLSNVRKHPLII